MRNGGKKRRKNREERVLYALKRGKKTGSPTEKRKGVKKVEKKQRGESFICFESVDNDKRTKAMSL